jgi:hypothetical protein
MSRCIVGFEDDVAEPYNVTRPQHAIDLCRRKTHDFPVGPIMEIALAAVLHRRDIGLHHCEPGTTQILEECDGASVIGMGVTVDDDLDVFGLETELLDGLDD